ncbi:hypothetical protein C0J52_02862 [Blattella germanica]|nr:hypothetical protein C0J52_02862 [Blattella germanica]
MYLEIEVKWLEESQEEEYTASVLNPSRDISGRLADLQKITQTFSYWKFLNNITSMCLGLKPIKKHG